MSALARYFIKRGLVVAGYDKTPSALTHQLEKEGMLLHYEENIDEIPHACKNPQTTLVVYTPAIPAEHQELKFFKERGFVIQKRAQVLGTLTRSHARKDYNFDDVCAYHAPESHRLQRFPWWNIEELRHELHSFRQRLRRHRGR